MKKYALVAFAALAMTGCAGIRPIQGTIYADLRDTTTATSNQTGNKVGEACANSILGIVATGDSSIETARRNGGITMISSVDNTFKNYVGVYSTYCTIVRGR